ncbi:peptide chain release factor N(5)-glutamine methyltransferase [Nitrosomonas sp. Is37]|uniref:peptide chain release factor N(5)-glutamine methyltransferase n=1 Tax=Nitrosomonas sp. Is37 TaxID=3080535 RepID=UPI00294AC8DB|nr:peptide chain release factor N(5)-glutamine methyltransferase [Nitrosomonas sp. Is37]MDV6343523.1 peptide chain release factor N(5)-glutamine methyltransferase [Nitrosomonas sp. Is37]
MQVTIAQTLQDARRHIDDIEARLLLQYALNVNAVFLAVHSNSVLNREQVDAFQLLVTRRIAGEPVAYLVGERDFYDLTFKVTPAVLIPRPETELLVELALSRIPVNQTCNVLDLGTGSGAIALTIAKHRPLARVTAVDLSPDALSIARLNAEKLGIHNVQIRAGNWFDGLDQVEFDLIVSNPPYVAEGDPHLDQGDLRFEPRIALTAVDDGLACIRKIIVNAPDFLTPGGELLLEHGYDQGVICRQLLAESNFINIFSCPDLAGILRVSGGQRDDRALATS